MTETPVWLMEFAVADWEGKIVGPTPRNDANGPATLEECTEYIAFLIARREHLRHEAGAEEHAYQDQRFGPRYWRNLYSLELKRGRYFIMRRYVTSWASGPAVPVPPSDLIAQKVEMLIPAYGI